MVDIVLCTHTENLHTMLFGSMYCIKETLSLGHLQSNHLMIQKTSVLILCLLYLPLPPLI